jgi:hypothetical protein
LSELAYDAERGPDAARWRVAGMEERVMAVEAHHAALAVPHPPVERARVHAALHVVVEDQVARNDPPEAARALTRLVAAGASRHEAIHAIGRIASGALAASLEAGRFDAAAYARALDGLGPRGGREPGKPPGG